VPQIAAYQGFIGLQLENISLGTFAAKPGELRMVMPAQNGGKAFVNYCSGYRHKRFRLSPSSGGRNFMSAHAYSEPYSYDRRHARHQLRNLQPIAVPRKAAEIVKLIPREYSREKQIELVYPKYKGISGVVALALIIGLHFVGFAYFYFKPEAPITTAEIPPMTVELYRPPLEQPPAPVIPEEVPPPPPPKVEKPKPIEKPKPRPVEPKPEPVAQKEVETPPAPPVASPPQTLTPATANPGYLRNPAPEYPELAVERGWEGTVILNVHVLGNGKPSSVEVKTSSGRNVLDNAALQTVRRWSFVPAKQGDTPVDSWVEVPIDFKLSNS
jgi:periplasmic protein TonB